MLRRAAVNKGLLITLVILVLASGGFWVWKWKFSDPPITLNPNATGREFNLACTECKAVSVIPEADWRSVPEDPNTKQFQCPKCKKFAASFQRRSGGLSLSGDGGG